MRWAAEFDPRALDGEGIKTTPSLMTETAVDLTAAQHAVRGLLVALGFGPSDEGLVETPRRVASTLGTSYAKQFSGKYSHRIFKGIGHNVPREAPQGFAEAVVDVNGIDRR